MTTADRDAILIAESLAPHQVKAIKILAGAFGSFEPVGFRPGLGQRMIDGMIEQGLAEKGLANEFTGKVGYRLTDLGSKVRWSLDKRRPKRQPSIRTLEPLIKQLDIRTAKPIRR